MKITINALNCITKLSLDWFSSISFCFEMRANLPGVGAGLALSSKGSEDMVCFFKSVLFFLLQFHYLYYMSVNFGTIHLHVRNMVC